MSEELTPTQEWLLDQVSDGFTVDLLCKEPGAPTLAHVRYWLRHSKEFADRYNEALVSRHTLGFERAWHAAMLLLDPSEKLPMDYTGRVRTAVETILKVASKLTSHAFGDKVNLEHSTRDGESLNMVVEFVKPDSPEYTGPKVTRT